MKQGDASYGRVGNRFYDDGILEIMKIGWDAAPLTALLSCSVTGHYQENISHNLLETFTRVERTLSTTNVVAS